MRVLIAVSLFGAVVALGAQQATPPPPPTPAPVQGPRPQVPTVQAPRVQQPTVQQPTVQTPTVQQPQTFQPVTQAAPATAQMGQGQQFEATWSATGQRQSLSTDGGRVATTVQLSGSVMITTGAGLSRGFRGEVLGFDDGAGLIAGRVVWTDDKGDKVFSSLFGDAVASAGRQMHATITGGTGRYAGLSGEYQFRWLHMIATDDEAIAGRAADLRGFVRPMGGTR